LLGEKPNLESWATICQNSRTTQFKKDIKRQIRCGKDVEKLLIVNELAEGRKLAPHYHDHKNTRNYDEWLVEHLKDPEEAQAYLEAVFEEYEKDGDTTALLLALRSVAQAQRGIGKLADWKLSVECPFEAVNLLWGK
jgi:hypothetical protein